ncbi:MAG: hypothetical protein DME59_04575 [Verrucomicrobia bacterium]|nr:MAG: hypothetical protein DME59_04575 [Verrucomicrobiota bacterium]PYL75156.1 MAG: hypothetical protein DMF26_08910 [Verrucomicrobiota bacterium]
MKAEALKRQTLNRHSERSRGIPLDYFSVASRDPSTPLRSAQDDHFPFQWVQLFNLLAMKTALHKISR